MIFGLKLGNLIPALFFIINGYSYIFYALNGSSQLHYSAALQGVNMMLVGIFFLTRKDALVVSEESSETLSALVSTFTPGFFMAVKSTAAYALGYGLQTTGIFLSIAATMSLNRAFGILPANRGVKTTGLYRFMRHPLYVGYLLSFGGFILNNTVAINAAVFLVWLIATLHRTLAEERILLKDPDYAEYAKRVRWRFIPYVI
ncbi:Phospholipid methyltransferase [uncultured archaeon]|nr:Phospholipid methyltransferase [uncultured archaeon]